MSTILALESSCDETAVAILRRSDSGKVEILASEISSQIPLHRQYGGVVPELASRNHTTIISPLVAHSIEKSGVSTDEIDAYSATAGPGLAAALLVGNTFAKGLALAANKPFISVNHMEGHLLSPFIEKDSSIPTHLALIVSGGHTMLVNVQSYDNYRIIGKTRDDAAGEAFDKVGKMFGLPYPGGPEIEKLARQGDPKAFAFPRTMLKDPHYDFSFSGLKTAVLYTLDKLEDPQSQLADLCASFQQAIIDTLLRKTLRAAKELGHTLVTVSGGVSCNTALCEALQSRCEENGLTFLSCPPQHSTDNATMIAYAALQAHEAGKSSPLTSEIKPTLKLA